MPIDYSLTQRGKLGLISMTSAQVLYMSSNFWLLRVESRDFSQAEKETTASKAEQIYKRTTIFTQNKT